MHASGEDDAMNDDLRFLEEMTRDVVEASRVRPGQSAGAMGVSRLPCTIVRPGGGDLYPSLWTRDFAMSVESGYITLPEVRDAMELLARAQCLTETLLASGSLVTRGAIADHINLQGAAIYYPGTYDPAEQGGAFGKLPCLDDEYFFVFLLWYAARHMGWEGAADHSVQGLTLLERAEIAFAMPPVNADTSLVHSTEELWGISFGFTDTVMHTGDVLFASLLRAEAAGCLAELCGGTGAGDAAARYGRIRDAITRSVPAVLMHAPSGLLRASTGKSGQPDLWGTAYALYRGLLPAEMTEGFRKAVRNAITDGAAGWEGQIRHVPAAWDFSAEQVWQSMILPFKKGTYQHGAYWATPLGWVLDAIAPVDPACAHHLLSDYVNHLRREDYRTHGGNGAPWECVHPDGDYRQNGVYMASVAAVLPAARRLRG
jgi:hypothetical protein